jgi:ELWxxDGT repeat protein
MNLVSFAQFDVSLVKDINPGPGTSHVGFLATFDDYMVLQASDNTNGIELYISDGTESGTYMLYDHDTSGNGFPRHPSALVNNYFYYIADNSVAEVYRLDTALLTVERIAGLDSNFTFSSMGYELLNIDDELIFAGLESGSSITQYYRWDEATSSIFPMHDMVGLGCTYAENLAQLGDQFLFAAGTSFSAGGNGIELYASEGVPGTAELILEQGGSTASGNPRYITALNDSLGLFVCNRGNASWPDFDLFATNGQASGTYLLKDINPFGTSGIDGLHFLNGKVVFRAKNDMTNNEPWVSDGTAAGTYMLKEINPAGSSGPNQFMKAGNQIFFTAYDDTWGRELYVTDGTVSGTRQVKDINPGSASSLPVMICAHDDHVYFAANNGIHGKQIWASKGTSATTKMLTQENDTASGFTVTVGTVFKDTLFFRADLDPSIGPELYKLSDVFTSVVENELILEKQLTVFPNPTFSDGEVSVAMDGAYKIYSMSGKLVDSGVAKNGRIRIKSLNPAPYIIRMDEHFARLIVMKRQ